MESRTMDLVNALGMFASIISFVLFLPQAVSTWKNRKDPVALSAISPWTQGLILVNASTWWAYAYLTGEFWIGAPGFINAPLALVSIWLILRARRGGVPLVGCHLCLKGLTHQVFITAPPGWGSIMECNETTRRNGVVVVSDDEIRKLRIPA